MPFTKILVALDHSEAAARAADIAKDLAHALHAELSLVFVADTESGLSGDAVIAPDDLAAALGQDAKRLLTKYSEHLGPVSNKFILFGAPGEEIVKTAQEWPADLIVIGSYGGSVLRDALLGSVAEFVMRHGPCPILVVRAKESGQRRPIPASKRSTDVLTLCSEHISCHCRCAASNSREDWWGMMQPSRVPMLGMHDSD